MVSKRPLLRIGRRLRVRGSCEPSPARARFIRINDPAGAPRRSAAHAREDAGEDAVDCGSLAMAITADLLRTWSERTCTLPFTDGREPVRASLDEILRGKKKP
jgi:hypothetical protein